eukprot:TRINITY_DN5259_c0_g1_i5.p1 TRINITY_DN5259_c0_g1~~TRINITY_DN5259_c0_g1_i5.p1  ORF type:complete len:722 (-),score=89.54 TRINITY_DN5259_c0_g1_i5:286-2451(-)
MLASELKLLPHVGLHPVHRVAPAKSGAFLPAQGAPDPRFGLTTLQLERSSRGSRKEQLKDFLQEVILSEIGDFDEQATSEADSHQVLLGGTCMVVENHDGGLISILLMFTDVVEAVMPRSQGASYAVALAPRPRTADSVQEATGGHPQSCSNIASKPSNPPLQDVWVFMVTCDLFDLKRLLVDLGSRGALRWDLHECYAVAKKPLGEGGCAKVFVGQSIVAENVESSFQTSEELCRDVAVKVLNRKGPTSEEDLVRKEIDFLVKSRGHPNVTALQGVFCDCDHAQGFRGARTRWFIVTELCSCGDLFDHLSGGALVDEECASLMQGLSSALNHLHMLRIVHRDVKPENILMGAHSQPILADMGIAANLDEAVEMAVSCGSLGYAAPELLSGRPYNELVDIFSAGCVYYYALSRQKPFQGADDHDTRMRTICCKERYPLKWFRHVSACIVNLVKFCLAKDPRNRPCARQCMESIPRTTNANSQQYPTADSTCSDVSASSRAMDRPGHAESASLVVSSSLFDMAGLGDMQVSASARPEAALQSASSMLLPSTPEEAPVAGPEAALVSSSPMVWPSTPEKAPMAGPEAVLVSPSPVRLPSTLDESHSQSALALPAPMALPCTPDESHSQSLQKTREPLAPSPNLPTQNTSLPSPSKSVLGKPGEPSEFCGVMPMSPAKPAEHQNVVHRPRSIPGRIKRTLCSMPSSASRWMAFVFQKTSRVAGG